jgi:hypothetical protein
MQFDTFQFMLNLYQNNGHYMKNCRHLAQNSLSIHRSGKCFEQKLQKRLKTFYDQYTFSVSLRDK